MDMRLLGIGNVPSPTTRMPAARPVAAPVDVRALRTRLGLTQAGFSKRFGFPLRSVRRWESGHETPQRPALVLLNLIEHNPQVVLMAARPRSAR